MRPTAALCYPDRMNSRPTTGREVTYCGHRRPGHMKTSDQTKMTDLICKYCLKRGHSKETCWTLDPNQKPARFGGGPPRRGCTQCGRIHYIEHCTVTTNEELASLQTEGSRRPASQLAQREGEGSRNPARPAGQLAREDTKEG